MSIIQSKYEHLFNSETGEYLCPGELVVLRDMSVCVKKLAQPKDKKIGVIIRASAEIIERFHNIIISGKSLTRSELRQIDNLCSLYAGKLTAVQEEINSFGVAINCPHIYCNLWIALDILANFARQCGTEILG